MPRLEEMFDLPDGDYGPGFTPGSADEWDRFLAWLIRNESEDQVFPNNEILSSLYQQFLKENN
jgi:hypothetical protein